MLYTELAGEKYHNFLVSPNSHGGGSDGGGVEW